MLEAIEIERKKNGFWHIICVYDLGCYDSRESKEREKLSTLDRAVVRTQPVWVCGCDGEPNVFTYNFMVQQIKSNRFK